MIRKKAREGYLLVYKTDEYITVTSAVSAPAGTDLTDWEELPDHRNGHCANDPPQLICRRETYRKKYLQLR